MSIHASLPCEGRLGGLWSPDLCLTFALLSIPACRGDRKKGITAAWKLKGADSTTRPSAGCWSLRSRVCADLRFHGATSPHPCPLQLTLLPPHLSAPPLPCRLRPSPLTPCTPPSSLHTTKRRRRTSAPQVRISTPARQGLLLPPLSHGSPAASRARPPMASFSPTHSSHPRPVPTVLLAKQASPCPLQKKRAASIPATPKVEVNGRRAGQPISHAVFLIGVSAPLRTSSYCVSASISTLGSLGGAFLLQL